MSILICSTISKHVIDNLRAQIARHFSTTPTLFAEPPKKKRRIDPAVLKLRVERKIKKAEREIARLEAEPRQLIPIIEYQYTKTEIRDLKSRPQHTMQEFDVTPEQILGAQKLWSIYRSEQAKMADRSLKKIEQAQESALEQLRLTDPVLYDRTVAVDDTVLIPYRSNHMRRESPPNDKHTPPDGIIKDVSKQYVM